MAEQRQPFRFRLPWLGAPATPQPTPAPAPAPAQRPPFRPAGVAPPQPPPPAQQPTKAGTQPTSQPPSKFQPNSQPSQSQPNSQLPSQPRPTSQPPSQSQEPTPSQAPPASPTRAAPQTQAISQPSSRRVSPQSKPGPRTQVSSQTASPAQRVSPPPKQSGLKAPATPPLTPPKAASKRESEVKPPSPSKKQPTTINISQPQTTKEEQPQTPPKEPKPEKVVASLGGPKKQSDSDEPKPKAATKVATRVPGPKPEDYQAPSEEPEEMLRGMNYEEPREKRVTETQLPGSKAGLKRHPLATLEERGQHPNEEVFDRKEVLARKPATAGEKAGLLKDVKEGPSRFPHKIGGGHDKHLLHEKPYSIITLTGENTGATMHLSSETSNREQPIHICRGYKSNPDESAEASTDGEGSSRGRKSAEPKTEEELATNLYLNNNTQGVNNSLVFESSVTERNPGVHVVLACNLVEPVKPGKQKERVETRKAEVATTPAERLAYAPTIRRRCLRGLFLESSDSDSGNPKKPRRHGCRVGCRQMSSDDSVDVL